MRTYDFTSSVPIFANGAAFAAFAAILQSGVAAVTNNGSGNQTPQQTNPTSSQAPTQSQAQPSGMSKVLSVVGDVVGKIWNLPNTIIGATIGGIGHVVGEIGQFLGLYNMEPTISFGNNAIQFENNPFTPAGGLTVGNAIIYGGGATPANIGFHEAQHTYQGQVLGPFYLPLNLIDQAASLTTYPVVSWRGPSPVHGKANFMEVGPLSTPSRPTPWK